MVKECVLTVPASALAAATKVLQGAADQTSVWARALEQLLLALRQEDAKAQDRQLQVLGAMRLAGPSQSEQGLWGVYGQVVAAAYMATPKDVLAVKALAKRAVDSHSESQGSVARALGEHVAHLMGRPLWGHAGLEMEGLVALMAWQGVGPAALGPLGVGLVEWIATALDDCVATANACTVQGLQATPSQDTCAFHVAKAVLGAVQLLLGPTSPRGLGQCLARGLQGMLAGGFYAYDALSVAASALLLLALATPTPAAHVALDAVCAALYGHAGGPHSYPCAVAMHMWPAVSQVAALRALLAHTPPMALLQPTEAHQSGLLLGPVWEAIVGLCGDHHPLVLRRLGMRNTVLWLEVCARVMGVGPKKKNAKAQGGASDALAAAFADPASVHVQGLQGLVWGVYDEQGDVLARTAHSAYGLLLALHRAAVGPSGPAPLIDEGLVRVLGLDWRVRGRYPMLAQLLDHTDPTALATAHPPLAQELLSCLGYNHLTPPAAEFHGHWLQACTRQWGLQGRVAVDCWADMWMERLLGVLVAGSDGGLQRRNMLTHWLPGVFGLLPAAATAMCTAISHHLATSPGHSGWLGAYLGVVRTAQAGGVAVGVEGEGLDPHVVEALGHVGEDLRLDAVACLCQAAKGVPSASVLCALQGAILGNMASPSQYLRQQQAAQIKRLLQRIRDSVLQVVRSVHSGDEALARPDVARGVGFALWLGQQAVWSLAPDSCYQRRLCALMLLDALLALLAQSATTTHVHKVAVNVFVPVQDLLLGPPCCQVLLHALQCSYADVRSHAAAVLVAHYKPPLPAPPMDTAMGMATRLLQTCAGLMGSQRPLEVATVGAHVQVLWRCYAAPLHWHMQLQPSPEWLPPREAMDGGAQVVLCLWGLLRQRMATAQTSLLAACMEGPPQGIIAALHQAVLEVDWRQGDLGALRGFARECISEGCVMARFFLGLLSGSTGEKVPTFADISTAIEAVAQEDSDCEDSDTEDPSELLGADTHHRHQLVLNSCWLATRGLALLLAALCGAMAWPGDAGRPEDQLTVEEIEGVGQLLVFLLTRCRHRGVLDSANAALQGFCPRLFRSSHSALQALPRQWWARVSALLAASHNSDYTRRSAGIPMLVQVLVASEPTAKVPSLRREIIDQLLQVAGSEVVLVDENMDLPQVHAINVLRALLLNSLAGPHMADSLGAAMILAIRGFESAHWAIRNAATMLLQAVCSRMFGQKQDSGLAVNCSMAATDLFGRYPSLCPFMATHLQQPKKGGVLVPPTVFPILVVLAALLPPPDTMWALPEELSALHMHVQAYTCSPVLHVRKLACRALLAFVPPHQAWPTATTLLRALPACPPLPPQDTLHGTLLQAATLTATHPAPSHEAYVALHGALTGCLWMADPAANGCAVTRTALLSLAMHVPCSPKHFMPGTQAQHGVGPSIGHDLWAQAVGAWGLAQAREQGPDHVAATCERMLGGVAGMQAAAIGYLADHIGEIEDGPGLGRLVARLMDIAVEPRGESCRSALKLLHLVAQQHSLEASIELAPQVCTDWYMRLAGRLHGHRSLADGLLPVMGAMLNIMDPEQRAHHVGPFVSLLAAHSSPSQPLAMRQAAADAMLMAPHALADGHLPGPDQCTLWAACVCLLQDEDEGVRNASAHFVCSHVAKHLPRPCPPSRHPPIALAYAFDWAVAWGLTSAVCAVALPAINDLHAAFQPAKDMRGRTPFEREAANIYSEDTPVIDLSCAALPHLLSAHEATDLWLRVWEAVGAVLAWLEDRQDQGGIPMLGREQYVWAYRILRMLSVLGPLCGHVTAVQRAQVERLVALAGRAHPLLAHVGSNLLCILV